MLLIIFFVFLLCLLILFITIFFKIKFLKNIVKYDRLIAEEKRDFFCDFEVENSSDIHYFKYKLNYFNKKLEDLCNCKTNTDIKKYREKYGYDSERFRYKIKKV